MNQNNLVIDGDFREVAAQMSFSVPANVGSGTYVQLAPGSPWSVCPGQLAMATVFSNLPESSLQAGVAFVINTRTRSTLSPGGHVYFTSVKNSIPAGVRMTQGGHIRISFWVKTTGRELGLRVGRNFGVGSVTASDTIFTAILGATQGAYRHVTHEIPCPPLAGQNLRPGDTLDIEIFFDSVTVETPTPGGFSRDIPLFETTSGGTNPVVVVSGLDVRLLDRAQDTFDYTPSTALAVVPARTYRALLTQVGTANPTAIVLENELGPIVWTRTGAGTYIGTLIGAFTANKSYATASPGSTVDGATQPAYITITSADVVTITTGVDTELLNTPIEIRVYA